VVQAKRCWGRFRKLFPGRVCVEHGDKGCVWDVLETCSGRHRRRRRVRPTNCVRRLLGSNGRMRCDCIQATRRRPRVRSCALSLLEKISPEPRQKRERMEGRRGRCAGHDGPRGARAMALRGGAPDTIRGTDVFRYSKEPGGRSHGKALLCFHRHLGSRSMQTSFYWLVRHVRQGRYAPLVGSLLLANARRRSLANKSPRNRFNERRTDIRSRRHLKK
jgi:hypothetical protein